VTEIEIVHGALQDPGAATHAFFYLRRPSLDDCRPDHDEAWYRRGATTEDVDARPSPGEREPPTTELAKLSALKARIKTSGLRWREYTSAEELGQMVLEDLREAIQRTYPEASPPDPLDRDAADHEAFAASRTAVYTAREGDLGRLDEHAAGDGPPLVVLGESGSGKSALLANWAQRYEASHPGALLLLHFVGANPQSADWAWMLRRILGELQRHLAVEQAVPDDPSALRSAFVKVLHRAAARTRVVLLLDALNQLEDRDGAPDLAWLPRVLPRSVRLIVSTLPGRPLDELTKRQWPTLSVRPLDIDERRRLIGTYLAQYGKTLSPVRIERIGAAEQSGLPLYLRALLEEVRVYGDHDTLDQRIDHYLSAETCAKLYSRILQRYEEDYDRDRPGLVRDAMTRLWAARQGLSETELLESLGQNGEPLPRALWSPLYLVAETSLVVRSGLVGFVHDYFRQAVQARYLPGEADRRRAHETLADYFAAQFLGLRKVDELPWQLQRAHLWSRLVELLMDSAFFGAAWDTSPFDVRRYWTSLEVHSASRLVGTYASVLGASPTDQDFIWRVAMLLADTGHLREARSVLEDLAEHFRQSHDPPRLQGTLGNLAVVLKEQGDLEAAMKLHRMEAKICRDTQDRHGLQASLGNQALILKTWGRLDAAMALHRHQARLCRALRNRQGLATSLGGQAMIFEERGQLEKALRLHRHEEHICRVLGDLEGLLRSVGNQGVIHHDRGDLDTALALYCKQEEISRELGSLSGLQCALGNQANVLHRRGEWSRAMELHKEEERICRDLNDLDGLQACLGNQAAICQEQGDLRSALQLDREKARICRALGNRYGLQISLHNQANVLYQQGQVAAAFRLHGCEERICRELGYPVELVGCLVGQAEKLLDQDRGPEAQPLLQEALALAKASGLGVEVTQIHGLLEHVGDT